MLVLGSLTIPRSHNSAMYGSDTILPPLFAMLLDFLPSGIFSIRDVSVDQGGKHRRRVKTQGYPHLPSNRIHVHQFRDCASSVILHPVDVDTAKDLPFVQKSYNEATLTRNANIAAFCQSTRVMIALPKRQRGGSIGQSLRRQTNSLTTSRRSLCGRWSSQH